MFWEALALVGLASSGVGVAEVRFWDTICIGKSKFMSKFMLFFLTSATFLTILMGFMCLSLPSRSNECSRFCWISKFDLRPAVFGPLRTRVEGKSSLESYMCMLTAKLLVLQYASWALEKSDSRIWVMVCGTCGLKSPEAKFWWPWYMAGVSLYEFYCEVYIELIGSTNGFGIP